MQNKESVCAVVVTYNRKQLLRECLEALRNQSRTLEAMYIIDNFSNDGTPESLLEAGFIKELPPQESQEPWEAKLELQNDTDGSFVMVYYVRMYENTGGAGGFHEGVKRAYERGFDWLWLMDDDGIPDGECLANLLKHSREYDFIAPLVLNKEIKTELSFGLGIVGIKTEQDAINYARGGVIDGVANPFNGILISKHLIQTIGYIKKEMFIWGDEIEYLMRSKSFGFKIATVVDAIHYHPKDRMQLERICFGKTAVNFQQDKLRNYCMFRNMSYNNWRYGKANLIKVVLKYYFFFIFSRRFDVYGFLFFNKSVLDGIFSIWGGEKKYLKR